MSQKGKGPTSSLFCPKGHKLPHVTTNGRCNPLHCAVPMSGGREAKTMATGDHLGAKKRTKLDKLEAKATRELVKVVTATPTLLPSGASQTAADEGRMDALAHASLGEGRLQGRHAFIKDMPAPDADEVAINNWTDTRFIKLLPVAVAEIEYNLKYGDDRARSEAADKVLRATGRAQKEGALQGGASIILNLGGLQLPYMPKPQAQIVEGSVGAPTGTTGAPSDAEE